MTLDERALLLHLAAQLIDEETTLSMDELGLMFQLACERQATECRAAEIYINDPKPVSPSAGPREPEHEND